MTLNPSQKIPLSVPYLKGNEWNYVKECLDTGWVSSVGNYVSKFEKAVATFCDVPHAVATVNGTSALHITLHASGIQSQDEVIVPALTFIATANAVTYCGAHPIFIDCDPQTFCMNIEKLSDFLKQQTFQKKDGFTYNAKTHRKIKAILVVHAFGHPAPMIDLMDLAEKYHLDLFEDATESLGSEFEHQKTGSFGKAACFSFNGNKIITTGGGGMVVTRDPHLAHTLRHLTTQAKIDSIEYAHDAVGYNYRLSNLHAAIGVAQMEQLSTFIQIKRKNALLYQSLFHNTPIHFFGEQAQVKSNFWFYTIRVPRSHKNQLLKHLLSSGIEARPIWKLLPTLPMYQTCQSTDLTHAHQAYDTCLNLPCSVDLTEEQIHFVVETIHRYMSECVF